MQGIYEGAVMKVGNEGRVSYSKRGLPDVEFV
jgi:hypothetical protein